MSKGPLKLKEFLKRLDEHGVIVLSRERGGQRGKGSELILLRPESPGSKQGPQYPIKNHGKGTEIKVPVINAALRRFGIDKAEFWGERKKKKSEN
jgi:hypothetical protein